jgi:histidinol dehydrogenase
MTIRLSTSDPDFSSRFAAFLTMKREVSEDVDQAVRRIIADVRARGDAALIELTQRFDRLDLAAVGIRVTQAEIDAAMAGAKADRETFAALELARDRIASHHRRQLPKDDRYTDSTGTELGARWTAVESVGLYVPGGTASYPSSVLMNAIPAKVAGVPRVAMVVPSQAGHLNPLVLVAARLAGVDEIYRLGGAQAIAALAYGTRSVAPVVKIVGPGNAYVAAAKRQVFGTVGIDSMAGPSEVLVIADRDNDPEWVAAATYGAIILLRSLDEAPPLADRIAAEHLEIATRDPDALADRIRNAGAIFLGAWTPEVIGDYVGGSNHVLPTARSARFSSGLGVLDFMKRTSLLRLDRRALEALGPAAMALATAEGLEAHRRSVAIRLGQTGGRS